MSFYNELEQPERSLAVESTGSPDKCFVCSGKPVRKHVISVDSEHYVVFYSCGKHLHELKNVVKDFYVNGTERWTAEDVQRRGGEVD